MQIGDFNISHEIKIAKNSTGEIKIYCEADLMRKYVVGSNVFLKISMVLFLRYRHFGVGR